MQHIETLATPLSITFGEFAQLYLQSVRNRLKSINQLEFRLRKFVRRFSGRPLAEIRRIDIANYIDERLETGINPGTINIEISSVSSAYRHAIGIWGWNLRNPAIGQHLRQPEGRLRYLSEQEKTELLEASACSRISSRLHAFLQLALNTGCRKNELLKLGWRDIDQTIPAVIITSANSKNGKRRIIPLNRAAQQALDELKAYRDEHAPDSAWVFTKRNGERLKSIDGSCVRAFRKVGIVDFRIHDLRHTFASDLVKAGVSLYTVKTLLGHSSIKQTERYAHLATDALSQAVKVLDGLQNT